MGKIKTREKNKNIKLLDKSAMIGERMKSSFIRSKDTVSNIIDDGKASPSEYAGDKIQDAAGGISQRAVHTMDTGIKTVAKKRKEASRHQRAKQRNKHSLKTILCHSHPPIQHL